MAKAQNSAAMWKTRLLAELQRDKKKTIVLSMLLLVAIVLIGKLFLKGSPAPATAQRPAAVVPPALGGAAVPDPSGVTTTNIIPDSVTAKPVIPDNLSDTITRDIFKPDRESFPRVKRAKKKDVKKKTVEQKVTEEEIRQKEIQAEAAKLHLESTLTGSRPIAIINGNVLSKGRFIAEFRVEEIGLQSCVVEKEGVRVKLTMNK